MTRKPKALRRTRTAFGDNLDIPLLFRVNQEQLDDMDAVRDVLNIERSEFIRRAIKSYSVDLRVLWRLEQLAKEGAANG